MRESHEGKRKNSELKFNSICPSDHVSTGAAVAIRLVPNWRIDVTGGCDAR
jgi:hypothetical protein